MTTNKIQVLQALESIRVYSKVSEAVQCRMQEQFDDALSTLHSEIFNVSMAARIAKLETALKALVNDAENYVNASEEYISDSNFDESGCLAESHANLKVVSMPKARKALEE